MNRIALVRHGESTANAERWLAGHIDAPLTDLGRAQARAVRGRLAELRPDRVVASDLRRAADTAAIAWDGRAPPIRAHPAVRERNAGAWEGTPYAELRQSGAMNAMLSWTRGPPGGESHRALARRAIAFLAANEDAGELLVFGHGGWIRTVIGLVDGVPRASIGAVQVANTEVHVRDVAPRTWERLLAELDRERGSEPDPDGGAPG